MRTGCTKLSSPYNVMVTRMPYKRRVDWHYTVPGGTLISTRRQLLRTMVLAGGAILTVPITSLSSTGQRPTAIVSQTPTLASAEDCCMWACWLGHSTVLLNMGGTWILTDPVLFGSYGISLLGLTLGPHRISPPALSVDDLPKPDLVLLSHAHLDHMDRKTLNAIAERWSGELVAITAVNTSNVIRDLPWGSLN